MNFRTSYLVGLLATGIVVTAAPAINMATAAELLRITGPDGQVKPVIQASQDKAQSVNNSVRQYGPTTSSDTFWSISQAIKPDNGVTVYQVMAALYDANPHAFSGNNYNSLERGMILLVPSREVMLQTSQVAAKTRAEQNDERWAATTAVKPQAVAPAISPAKPATPTSALKAQPNPLIAELSEEVQMLTRQVEAIQAKNLELTDELARASDEIVVGSSDTAAFQDEISQLKQENALLKQALQDAKSESAALKQEVEATQQQVASTSEPQVEPTSDLWRTIMDNPVLLILGAVLPAILVIGLVWLFIRRKSETTNEAPANDANNDNDTGAADIAHEPKMDDADDLAVHLDTEETIEQDPLTGLAVGAMAQSEQDEQDIVVEDSQDDGQSLDDLWAEAMGEQEQTDGNDDVNAIAQPAEDDFDSLLADLDAPSSSSEQEASTKITKNSDEEDLDALLAGFDAPDEPAVNKANDPQIDNEQDEDLDALFAGFDEVDKTELDLADTSKQTAEDNVDNSVNAEANTTEDLDALLAGFDEPQANSTELEQSSVAESAGEAFDFSLDGSTDSTENRRADDDIDALLAGFDEPKAETTELEQSSVAESAGEALDFSLDDSTDSTENPSADDDIDALLAGFDEPQAETTELEQSPVADSATEALDFSLDDSTDSTENRSAGEDIDALLASFDEPNDKAIESDFDEEPASAVSNQDDLDTLLASLESEKDENDSDSKDIDTLSDEMAAELELGFEIAAELEDDDPNSQDKSDSELDSELDALLADLDSPADVGGSHVDNIDNVEAKLEDLAPQQQDDKSLDFDSNIDFSAPKELSDDELFSSLAAEGDGQSSANFADDDAFTLDDNSKMTVDEALAALDAEEVVSSQSSKKDFAQDELSSFQKDNDFIDIDMLLSEADEDNSDIDLYKQFDVDMGELDSLMGNSAMVDVDDEENSINAKLDLARAYIEIDDNDSASALLKEVELDGNERQQAEAARLQKELV
ncbi:pilus assembly protein FimV [Shewanella sairae]|uniref:Pilus assembly protein FimV n=1 Tax=Shewanella sairae TaxID=190310 RepID=A0ABQ4PH42_9GAMM|nr:FimV/HubP family polar landmark protein [Shewanella sairae]MCL1131222.1 pilus assembly protein FimV [Shewanella sairae]GIU46885.1 pilus assembly protein FimV [Shewanella sairae]